MPVNLRYDLFQPMGQAMGDYRMIDNGDQIAVGLSGGKDSLALLYALRRFQRSAPVEFGLKAITVDMGYGTDWSPLAEFCRKLEVPYHVEPTAIATIVFDIRREKNPCSLCANLRRGALNNAALAQRCNKVALAHHRDDAIETLLLSLFFEARLHCFSPVTYLSRKQLTVIRPLVYVSEAVTQRLARELPLPVVSSCCPANGQTHRADMKNLLAELEDRYPGLRERMLTALKNPSVSVPWRSGGGGEADQTRPQWPELPPR